MTWKRQERAPQLLWAKAGNFHSDPRAPSLSKLPPPLLQHSLAPQCGQQRPPGTQVPKPPLPLHVEMPASRCFPQKLETTLSAVEPDARRAQTLQPSSPDRRAGDLPGGGMCVHTSRCLSTALSGNRSALCGGRSPGWTPYHAMAASRAAPCLRGVSVADPALGTTGSTVTSRGP